MRHGDDRTFIFAQMMFEPRHRLGIEVIGRLIEQKDIGFGEQ